MASISQSLNGKAGSAPCTLEATQRSRRAFNARTNFFILLAIGTLFVGWEFFGFQMMYSGPCDAERRSQPSGLKSGSTLAMGNSGRPKSENLDFIVGSDDNQIFDLQGLQPRVWERRWDGNWRSSSSPSTSTSPAAAASSSKALPPLPCFQPNNDIDSENWRSRTKTKNGLVFIKPTKTGGSTFAGIHLRIARNVAVRQSLPENKEKNNPNFPTMCKVRFGHGAASTTVPNRDRAASFLWTVIRNPTKRAISGFFHFHVSRRKVEPSDANFQDTLIKNPLNFKSGYLRLMQHRQPAVPPRIQKSSINPNVYTVGAIIEDFDFIAITERMEESLVVLQYLLNLPLDDVLYLSAKVSGGFDDGRFQDTCFHIIPSFVTPGMRDFFQHNTTWHQMSRWDRLLYEVANQSLDRTIEKIGRKRVDAAVMRLRHALRDIQDRCADTAAFPCSVAGERRNDTAHQLDCMWVDMGCGTPCIDQYVKERGLSDVLWDG